MNKEKVLKSNKLFAFVPNKVLKSISRLFQEHFVNRSETLVEHGEPSQLFFLVHKGKVKALYEHHLEQELGAGDYFGEMALLGEKATVVNAFALQAGTEAVSITKTDFSHCLDAFPILSTVVTNIIAGLLSGSGLSGHERTVGNYAVTEAIVRQEREVWMYGEHVFLKRSLRIQLIPHLFIRDTKYRERLLSKLKVIASLRSSSIVRPLDVVKALGSFFIVYDREDGTPLSEIMAAARSIPHQIISSIVLSVAEILAFLHAEELVHTDLRPENIWVTRQGEIRLAGIGLMHPDYLVPEYMSPEQMQKKHVGKNTDVFSLGVLAYVLCSQKYPFPAKDEETLLEQKLSRQYTDLHEINPLLPASLVQFVTRCLEPKPDKRLENLSNLRDLFSLWMNAQPEDGKADDEKKKDAGFASQEQIVQWLHKKYFQDEKKKEGDAPVSISKLKRNGKDHFSPLFEKQDDFYAFKLLTFEEFAATHYSRKPELNVTFEKDELLHRLHEMERERQELIIAHETMKKIKKCTSRKELFDILKHLLAFVEKDGNYALLARKEKKIKNQAERIAGGSNYLPDENSDHLVIGKAETAKSPFLLREKNHFLLVCPLHTRTRFIGSICVADRVKKGVDVRMRFYRLLSEVVPVVELEF